MSLDARRILAEKHQDSVIKSIADKSYVSALVHKWKDLLEGVPDRTEADRYTLGVTAVLLENQSKYLANLDEETRSQNIGAFTKFIFPILRRVFPNLIANEIVSVQPMSAPVGAVFFMDYVYGSTKGGTTQGNTYPKDFDRDYSSEYVNGEPLATGDGVNFGGAGDPLGAVLAWNPVRPLNPGQGFKVVIKELDAATGADVQVATDDGNGGFTGDVASGTINYANGGITDFKFTAEPVNGNPIKAYYTYDGELNSQIPSVNLDVRKAPVEAQPRRLKALWSSEAAEDLRAFHGVDAETEIVSSVAQEIALEIDREILNDLFLASTGTTGTFNRTPPAGVNELDHLRAMITVISTLSNIIHKKTLRAPANWIVTSPEISALVTQLTTHADYRPLWVPSGSPYSSEGPAAMMQPGGTPHGQFGIYRTGSLMHKWQVYEDPFFPRDKMLIGLKGATYLEAGYAWAPYVPLQITPTFLDPNDFSFRKGIRTRYAKKLLRSEYYGQMTVQNL